VRPTASRFAFLAASLTALLACGDGGSNPQTGTTSATGGATTSSATGGSGGSLPPPKALSVVNWNVHDFFDTVNDNPNGSVLSSTDYTKKQKGIGGVLKDLNADVVMLAEVERQHILDDMNKNVLGNMYANRTLIEANDPRGINIALMSKIPPDAVTSHKDDTFTKVGTNGPIYHYSRDCLEVRFTFNGRKLVLLGVHFKSKLPTDDPDKRLAEAQHTRAIADGITKDDPTALVIVLGDYNDTPASPPVNAVAGVAPSLYADAADAVTESLRHSFDFNGTLELIDHQMGNDQAAKLLDPTKVLLKHGAGIDDATKYASDHAPLFAVYGIR
jgi:endonuclease/exonuclease/phosphatase family metal-dependent hydrolase